MNLMSGSLAVIWVLATSRWGSYLPREPIFFVDLFLVGALIKSINIGKETNSESNQFTKDSVKSSINLYWLFLVYILVKVFFADWNSPFTTARDFMPYFYVIFFFFAYYSTKNSNPKKIDKSFRFFLFALFFHSVWTSFSLIFRETSNLLPLVSSGQNLNVFEIRADVDMVFLVVFAITYFFTTKKKLGKIYSLCLFFVSLLFNTRAGVFAFALIILFTLIYTRNRIGATQSGQKFNFAIPFIVISLLIAAFSTNAEIVNRVSQTIDPNVKSTSSVSGYGTTQARIKTWGFLIDWTASQPSRLLFGVPFGNNYMYESEALTLLVGKSEDLRDYPRQPHNFIVGTFARLGILGLLLWILLLSIFVSDLRRVIFTKHLVINRNYLLSTNLVIGIFVISIFGVVLESPFGAVPFYWFLGYLRAFSIRLLEDEK